MNIKLPPINGEARNIIDKQSIVLVGANGSGKTRMSVWIENNNPDINIHRISAQKSLNMPKHVQPKDIDVAREELFYGTTNENKSWLKTHGKINGRWLQNPNTAMLNDFDKLMIFLFTEDYQKSIEYRNKHKYGDIEFTNTTKLEEIKKIWESVLPHRELQISSGKIEVSQKGDVLTYNGSEMSDGERAIFYFIGEVLSVPSDSLIIIDEPENHLHKSILRRLWDYIEEIKSDCLFVYITHDVDFAVSRVNSSLVWIKNFYGNDTWDYQVFEDTKQIPDYLMVELLGSRKNILFIEGTSDSYDAKIYPMLFEEYTVIPLGGCQKVLEATKTFNELTSLHYLTAKGIIDRDRKGDEYFQKYKNIGIYAPNVAEIENFFLIEEVVRVFLESELKTQEEQDDIIEIMKMGVFDFFGKHLSEQALLYTKYKVSNLFNGFLNEKASDINSYNNNFKLFASSIDLNGIFESYIDNFKQIIGTNNYDGVLKILNHKGLLPECGLIPLIGMKKDTYIDKVIRLMRVKNEKGNKLKLIFKKYIEID